MPQQVLQSYPSAGYPPQAYYPAVVQPSLQAPTIFRKRAAVGLGIVQVVIGSVCLIMNAILRGFSYPSYFLQLGYGIWGGSLFILAGTLQISSANGILKKGLIVSSMVLNIIAACATPVLLAFGVVDAMRFQSLVTYSYAWPNKTHDYNVGIAVYSLNVIIAILAIVEAVVSIVGSALCCEAVCSCCRSVPIDSAGNQPVMHGANLSGYPAYSNYPAQTQPQPLTSSQSLPPRPQHSGQVSPPYYPPGTSPPPYSIQDVRKT